MTRLIFILVVSFKDILKVCHLNLKFYLLGCKKVNIIKFRLVSV